MDELEAAIRHLAHKAKTNSAGDGALKYSQAALNVAHALSILRTLPASKE